LKGFNRLTLGSPLKQSSAGIKEVAAHAGVSVGTVSHVLNHPGRVTTSTRKRVLLAMEELGFVRNSAASQLRAGRRTAIGLVVPDIANPFFAEVARGAEDESDAHGYSVLICNSAGSSTRQKRHLQFLLEERVSGVLLTPVDDRETEQVCEPLRNSDVHVVLADHISSDADHCSVAVDHVRGGELAGRHLAGIGAIRVAYLGGPDWIRQCTDRFTGIKRAVEGAGVAGRNRRVTHIRIPALTWRAGYEAVDETLAARPDAVFCANDIVALGVLRGFIERSIRVPHDIALMGYDDIDFASSAAVPLSSIRQPAYQIGKASAALLLEEAKSDTDSHTHQQILFRPELVERNSTRRDRQTLRDKVDLDTMTCSTDSD
jgi:LacI family transcriptional regulator